MKAAKLIEPEQIKIVEIPKPCMEKENQVLVRVKAVGICGTDLHTFKGERNDIEYPRVMGHELSGVVEEIGKSVVRVKRGDRVIYDPVNSCKVCKTCKSGHENICKEVKCFGVQMDGGFQEYIVVEEDHLYPFEAEVTDECAALGEPFSIAANMIARAEAGKDDHVVVYGAGTIGIAVLQVLKKAGAKVLVTDIADTKLKLAEEFGADVIVNSKRVNLEDEVKRFSSEGADIVIDAVGFASILEEAVKLAASGGRIVEIGFDDQEAKFAPGLITRKELTIAGSRMNCHRFPVVVKWLSDGTITDKMISATYPLEEIQKAFEDTLAHGGSWLKTVIQI